MKKLLGPHLAGSWISNLETLRQWQPPIALVLQPDVGKVEQLREACPQAIIVGRFFHDDSHYASNIAARPKEFAREIHQEIIGNPVTPLLDYIQSNNEVCQDWDGIQKLNQFSQEWMRLADQSQAYKCAILAFSVGNPDLPHKPGDPAGFDGRMLYWQQVLASLNYAQAKNHILLLHAYGYPNMFAPDADWYIYRYERQVQANLKTLGITNLRYAYGEIGIDRLIVGEKGGYKVVTNDQDYVNQNLQWERDQQGQDLLLGGAIFTLGDSGGWGTYDIASTNVASMIADHYVEHAGDYNMPDAPAGNQTHIPAVGTGTSPTPALPPRIWDERLTARGVTVKTPQVAPGQQFWRAVEGEWFDEQQSQGRHHIYADVLDDLGMRVVGVPFLVRWPDGTHPIVTEAKPGEDWATNYPMSPSRNEFSIQVHDGKPSELVTGIGMGADTPGGFNASTHTSTGIVFQLVTMPAATQPTPAPQPVPATPYTMFVSVPAGANLRDKPIDGRILRAIPYGADVIVTGTDNETGWKHVTDGAFLGWMAPMLLSGTKPTQEPTSPAPEQPGPVADNWSRAWPIVLKIEGGLSLDPNDTGNYYQGRLVGTKFGISAAVWGGQYDIPNLTKEQALNIYKRAYWDAANCDALPWPMCLIVFDTAINHGVGVAKQLLNHKPTPEEIYLGLRMLRYIEDPKWKHFGIAWGNRAEHLDDIVDGEVNA